MMLICRFKTPNFHFRFQSTFSHRTLIKHLSPSNPNTFITCRARAKPLTTTRVLNSSHFETLTFQQQDQIRLYVDSLLQWNQKMNLTAVKEVNEVMERHIEDSLAILPPIYNNYTSHCSGSSDNLSLVDVGTGAGLPGLVLAIACPGWKVTLLESMNKRCVFLEHAVSLTGLSNVKVVRGRAENLGQNLCFREQFDVAVARAVAEMRILAEYCLPLVRVGGLFVAAKGHDPKEEVRNAERAVQLMGASLLQLCTVESQSPFGQRTAIVCLKDRCTPKKYPRDPGNTE
ncbi:ribosomal RNA small subunit methyltransferase G isoform X2 [Mangifera indica]|uniref:ribosomal RNA small subunit methyltransferase G isoform X2 n=1 Tax=Mangifera indica TaxID=29780 RepID=UPI001CF9A523|nr:ribosomal RNA small subunit methyltransferase G isoform X2 [Mangifera indica]XP_044487503.1 ribosomal RNA small subunit methyltransferase G isoform X2 [Mangifera indica]